MMQYFKTKRFQFVELIIPASVTGTNQQTFFNQQPQLQSQYADKRIYVKGIEAYSVDTLNRSPLSSNVAMASAADIRNGVLTLSIEGENQLWNIPLAALCRLATNAGFTPWAEQMTFLKNQWRVDWTKSYVQTVLSPSVVPFTYGFGVYYDYYPDNEDIFDPNDPSGAEYMKNVMKLPFHQ